MGYISDPPYEDVANRLRSAIRKLLKEDRDLFDFAVNERTVTQRLAVKLEAEFSELRLELKADCEYNRMWIESGAGENLTKTYPREIFGEPRIDDIDAVTVFPDVIVHLRGTQFANILVIEAKRNAPAELIPENDRIKLHEFTKIDGDFRYPWGAYLNFRTFKSPEEGPHRAICLVDAVWFSNGKELRSEQIQRE
jgi:hypothetical protein